MDAAFEQNLAKYAEVAVKIGLNLQPGQRLLIGVPFFNSLAPVEAAPLVRLIAAQAYQVGAKLVDVMWSDDQLNLIRVQHASHETFQEYPAWQVTTAMEYIQKGDAVLLILAHDPDLFQGQDPKRVASIDQVARIKTAPIFQLMSSGATNWSVITVPLPGWSAKVFPNLTPDAQSARMWDTIFDICRVKNADPMAAWRAHMDELEARGKYLTGQQYTALRYTGPGTDLTVGLPSDQLWGSARFKTNTDIIVTCNLPTEEVGTAPDKDRTDGYVTATKPMGLAGGIVEDFSVTFAKGRVVKINAKRGEQLLRDLIETDEGACRLGEAALVPHSSPVSRTGLIFYNVILDENASCHLAFGQAYSPTGNQSMIHMDFMIGSDRVDVDGVSANGTVTPVMRGGEWAFKI
jgi:aminopeptidase